jgi:hypothetical protein
VGVEWSAMRRRHSLGAGRWRLDTEDWILWSRVEKLGLLLLGWITGLFGWIGYLTSITEEPNKISVYSNCEPNVRPRTEISVQSGSGSVQSGSVFGLGFFCPGLPARAPRTLRAPVRIFLTRPLWRTPRSRQIWEGPQ